MSFYRKLQHQPPLLKMYLVLLRASTLVRGRPKGIEVLTLMKFEARIRVDDGN